MTALLLLVSLAAPPAPAETPLDEKALAALVADLSDKDTTKQYTARDALVKAGPKAKATVPALVKLLGSDEAPLYHAIEVLGAIGPGAKPAVPALLARIAKDGLGFSYTTDRVATALMRIDGPKPEATRALLLSHGKCTPILLVVSATLHERPDAVVPHLVALCSDPDVTVREKAAIVLGDLKRETGADKKTLFALAGDGAKGVPAALEKLLADGVVRVRITAALSIARVAPELAAKSVPAIVAGVLAADEKGMEGSGNAVDAFRPVPNEAAKALIPLFDHKADHVRWWAMNTLAALPTGEALAAALKDGKTARTREAAALALGSRATGPNAAPALTAALKDSEFAVRFAAARSLVNHTDHGNAARTAAVPVFVEGLQEQDEKVRLEAGQNLVAIGADAKRSVPALKDLLTDEKPEVRFEAALALTAIDPKGATGAVPVFVAALKSGSEDAALRAAIALPDLGATAKDAVPELVKHYGAKNPHLQLRAAEAAGCIDAAQGPKAAEALVALLQDKKHTQDMIRPYALAALGRIGAPAKSALPALAQLLKDRGPFLDEAAFAMITIDADSAKAAYDWIRLMLKTNGGGNYDLSEMLPRLGVLAQPLVPELTTLLKAKRPYDRLYAIETLAAVGPGAKAALPELKALAESDPKPNVREAAADAVKKIEAK